MSATETLTERKAEALAILAAIQAKVETMPENPSWGHAGDAAELLTLLKQAARWA